MKLRLLVISLAALGVSIRGEDSVRRVTPESGIPPRTRLGHHTEKKFDWVPDYSKIVSVEIAQSGRWSELLKSLPLQSNDVVRIGKLAEVEFDAAETPPFRALVLEGRLTFAPERATRLTVGTLQVRTGQLTIRPTTGRSEVQFFGDLDRTNDPGQYSVGLLAAGGVVDVEGPAPKTIYSHLAGPTEAGARVLTLNEAPDWRAGDRVLVSGARLVRPGSQANELAAESEFSEIEKIEGKRVTLKSPLQYAHQEGVSHLSRQIRFATAKGSPVNGHLWFSDTASASVVGAEFEGLGRTLTSRLNDTRWNPTGTAAAIGSQQRGRYIIHAHHLINPIRIAGCVLFDRPTNRWAITLHASHGTIERNVIVFPGGAGIVAENGFETGIIRQNVLIGALGGGDAAADPGRGSLLGGDGHNLEDRGWEGFGLWLRSPAFEVTGNLTEGAFREAAYGFHIFEPNGEREATTFPRDPGRPKQVAGKSLGDVWCRLKGLQVFANNTNTAFIAREPNGGAALYFAHMFLSSPFSVENFTSRNSGKIFAYYSRAVEFSGLDLAGNADQGGNSPGLLFDGVSHVTIRDSTVRNCTVGLTPPLISLVVTNCLFDNETNFVFQPGDADCICHMSYNGRTHALTQVRFGTNSQANILMKSTGLEETKETDNAGNPNSAALAKMLGRQTRVIVRDYNGKSGDDFEVFYSEQAADFVLPGLGVSNQDLFAGKATGAVTAKLKGRSFNDRLVREPKTREGIVGLVGPIDKDVLVYDDNLGTQQMDNPVGSQVIKYNLGGQLVSSTEIAGGKTVKLPVTIAPGLNYITKDIPGIGPYTFLISGRAN